MSRVAFPSDCSVSFSLLRGEPVLIIDRVIADVIRKILYESEQSAVPREEQLDVLLIFLMAALPSAKNYGPSNKATAKTIYIKALEGLINSFRDSLILCEKVSAVLQQLKVIRGFLMPPVPDISDEYESLCSQLQVAKYQLVLSQQTGKVEEVASLLAAINELNAQLISLEYEIDGPDSDSDSESESELEPADKSAKRKKPDEQNQAKSDGKVALSNLSGGVLESSVKNNKGGQPQKKVRMKL